jgi:hypothetical protein
MGEVIDEIVETGEKISEEEAKEKEIKNNLRDLQEFWQKLE